MADFRAVAAKLRNHVALVLDEDELAKWPAGASGAPPLKWAWTEQGRIALNPAEFGALIGCAEGYDELADQVTEAQEHYDRLLRIAAALAGVNRPATIDNLSPADLRWLEDQTEEEW